MEERLLAMEEPPRLLDPLVTSCSSASAAAAASAAECCEEEKGDGSWLGASSTAASPERPAVGWGWSRPRPGGGGEMRWWGAAASQGDPVAAWPAVGAGEPVGAAMEARAARAWEAGPTRRWAWWLVVGMGCCGLGPADSDAARAMMSSR